MDEKLFLYREHFDNDLFVSKQLFDNRDLYCGFCGEHDELLGSFVSFDDLLMLVGHECDYDDLLEFYLICQDELVGGVAIMTERRESIPWVTLLTVTLLILKVANVISISWWWVFAPILFVIGFIIALTIIQIILGLILIVISIIMGE